MQQGGTASTLGSILKNAESEPNQASKTNVNLQKIQETENKLHDTTRKQTAILKLEPSKGFCWQGTDQMLQQVKMSWEKKGMEST